MPKVPIQRLRSIAFIDKNVLLLFTMVGGTLYASMITFENFEYNQK